MLLQAPDRNAWRACVFSRQSPQSRCGSGGKPRRRRGRARTRSRAIMSASSSRATRKPDSEVSAMSARHSRVKSRRLQREQQPGQYVFMSERRQDAVRNPSPHVAQALSRSRAALQPFRDEPRQKYGKPDRTAASPPLTHLGHSGRQNPIGLLGFERNPSLVL